MTDRNTRKSGLGNKAGGKNATNMLRSTGQLKGFLQAFEFKTLSLFFHEDQQ